jgi:hypothetical protein
MTIKSIVLQCILKWMCLSAINVSVMPFFFISIRSIITFINIMAYFVFCHINIPLFTQISIQINTCNGLCATERRKHLNTTEVLG